MKKWKILDSKVVFDNKWYQLRQDRVELPNGLVLDDYFVWINNDVVMVVPVTSDGKFVLVRQYKHGVGEVMIEFPAGFVAKDEDLIMAAVRELKEEIGFEADGLTELGKLANSPTKREGIIHIFLAENVTGSNNTSFDVSEDIEVVVVSENNMAEMIKSGEIWASDTLAAFLLYQQSRLSC